jgi:hypothetical protein
MKIYLILIFIIILSSCGTKKVTYDIIKDVLDKDSVIVVSTSMISLDSSTELPLQLRNGISPPPAPLVSTPLTPTAPTPYNKPKPIQIGSVKNVIVNIEQRSDNLEGLIGYTVPNDMIVGNKYTIKVRISRENNITKLVVGDRNIPISSDDNTTVNIESITISPVMSAYLFTNKDNFKVDILSTEYQNIGSKGTTEWGWDVVPLKAGDNILKLTVKIRVTENGETNYRDIIVFDKTLDIKTNIKFSILEWVKTNWQWFMVIILIPLVKWLYELYKGRNNNKL